jgi:hypothetical protein
MARDSPTKPVAVDPGLRGSAKDLTTDKIPARIPLDDFVNDAAVQNRI